MANHVFTSLVSFCTFMSRASGSSDVGLEAPDGRGSRYLSFLLAGSNQGGTLKEGEELKIRPALPYAFAKGRTVEGRFPYNRELMESLAVVGVQPNDYGHDRVVTASHAAHAKRFRGIVSSVASFEQALEGLEYTLELSTHEKLLQLVSSVVLGAWTKEDDMFEVLSGRVDAKDHPLLQELISTRVQAHNASLEG